MRGGYPGKKREGSANSHRQLAMTVLATLASVAEKMELMQLENEMRFVACLSRLSSGEKPTTTGKSARIRKRFIRYIALYQLARGDSRLTENNMARRIYSMTVDQWRVIQEEFRTKGIALPGAGVWHPRRSGERPPGSASVAGDVEQEAADMFLDLLYGHGRGFFDDLVPGIVRALR